MKLQDDMRDGGPACEPEWVALNHLFSYCAKARAVRAPDQSGKVADDARVQRCTHNSCMFGAARR